MNKCPAHGKQCHKCGLANHFAKFCLSNRVVKQSDKRHKDTNSVDVFTIQSGSVGQDGLIQQVQICDQTLSFQLDTGAQMSIMSEWQWNNIGCPSVKHTDLKPANYDGSQIETIGLLSVPADICSERKVIEFLVVKSNKAYGLLGRNVIDASKCKIETNAITSQTLPAIKGFKASIVLVDDSKPLKFFKARRVPVHLKDAPVSYTHLTLPTILLV